MARTPTALLALTLIVGAAVAASSARAAPVQEPPSMKAIRVEKFGGPEVLQYQDVPRPAAGPREVLVRVSGAGVNPVDWKVRAGQLKGFAPAPPFIPGYDVSGTIESVGAEVTAFKPGDEVYSYLFVQRGGAYAEYVAIPVAWVAKKPAKLDRVTAAAVPLAGLTAWQALFDQADLKAGQTVLIHGAAGGVGHFAVQFAKSRGAKVIATASAVNHEFLKGLGADEVIDYKTQKFEEIARDVDVVLDTIGGDTQARSYGVIKPGGILVSIVQPPDATKLQERGIRGKVFLVQPNAAQLTEIAALIDAGKVTPHVSDTFPLKDAAKAQEKSETGRTRGKIVLKVE